MTRTYVEVLGANARTSTAGVTPTSVGPGLANTGAGMGGWTVAAALLLIGGGVLTTVGQLRRPGRRH